MSACEFPEKNATGAEIREVLTRYKTIVVVGLSDKPDRPSYGVSQYMQAQGYRGWPSLKRQPLSTLKTPDFTRRLPFFGRSKAFWTTLPLSPRSLPSLKPREP